MLKIVHVLWGQIIVALVTFGGLRVYTELLDRESFGIAMLCMGAVSLLDGISVMALHQTVVALCSRLQGLEDRRRLAVGLLYLAVVGCATLALVATLVCALLSLTVPRLIFYAWVPIAIVTYLAAELTKSTQQALLSLKSDFVRLSFWSTGEAILGFGCTCMLLLVWRADWLSYLIGYFISRLLSCALFTVIFARCSFFRHVHVGAARKTIGQALTFGVPVAAMAPLGWISTFLDRFIIGSMMGAAETGTYVAATSLVSRPYALTTAVLTNYFRPQLYVAAQDSALLRQSMYRWILAALLIGAAGAIAIFAAGDFITDLMLAAPYRQGATVLMLVFSIAQTISIATHAMDNAILALGRSAKLLKIQTALSIFTVMMIPIGVFWMGAAGAVIARCFAEAAKFIGTWALFKYLSSSLRMREAK
nr:oligosaccharide flippase family protein [Bradyrhizobium sp. IC3195]